MSVRAAEVEIQRPCPVDLPEDFRAGARNRHCGHCSKTVHLLSSLSETEARQFLVQNADRDVCVTYLVDAAGTILFRPEPAIVPLAALRRPPRVGVVAAVGLGLALAACAPHDNPRIEAQVTQVDEPCEASPIVTHPEVLPPLEQRMMAGGIGPMEVVPEPPKPVVRQPMRAGGIGPPPPTAPREPAPTTMRGGRG